MDVVYAIQIYIVVVPTSDDTRNVLLRCRHSVFSMIRYDGAAGHVVLVECHDSFSAFNDPGCTTVRSGVVRLLGGVKIYFFQPPDTWYSYCYELVNTAPNGSIQTPKVQEIHLCLRFFLSYLRVFSVHYFVNLPPFRNSYPGSHGTHSSPFPTTVRAFVLIARKLNIHN